jgi:hypothetical protein
MLHAFLITTIDPLGYLVKGKNYEAPHYVIFSTILLLSLPPTLYSQTYYYLTHHFLLELCIFHFNPSVSLNTDWFCCIFVVYLTTLSVPLTIYRRMIE